MKVTFACGMWKRLKGLLGCTNYDGVLMLAPCNDVHTWGMKAPIDIAFVGSDGRVVKATRATPPRRRVWSREACFVLERFARDDEPWFDQGDYVRLEAPDGKRVLRLEGGGAQ